MNAWTIYCAMPCNDLHSSQLSTPRTTQTRSLFRVFFSRFYYYYFCAFIDFLFASSPMHYILRNMRWLVPTAYSNLLEIPMYFHFLHLFLYSLFRSHISHGTFESTINTAIDFVHPPK